MKLSMHSKSKGGYIVDKIEKERVRVDFAPPTFTVLPSHVFQSFCMAV